MTCQELLERLLDYHEGELEPSVRAVLEAHADDCRCCRALVSTYDLTVRLSAEIVDREVSDEVAISVLALARNAVHAGSV